MEKAENWSHYSLEQLKKCWKKGVGGDTKSCPDGDLTGETLPPIDYTGRVPPANSRSVVQCWFSSDTDKDMMSNYVKSLSKSCSRRHSILVLKPLLKESIVCHPIKEIISEM